MKMNKLFWGLLGIFALLSCSTEKVSGTATDTENTIAGTVLLSDSSVARGVLVRQVSARTATPAAFVETSTADDGSFAFDSSLADTVNLEFRYLAADSSLSQAQILWNVSAKKSERLQVRLQRPAHLRGILESSGNASNVAGSHFLVYLGATTFFADIFAPDSFSLGIPEGDYLLTVAPADSGVLSKLRNSGYADSSIVRQFSVSLSAGDTLDVGNLRWNLSELEPTRAKVLSGKVTDADGMPLRGVSVHVVTDLYGFGVVDSSAFVTQALSDFDGNWSVPAPLLETVVCDSFRVEFRGRDSLGNVLTGVSPYIGKDVLKETPDVVRVGTVTLSPMANFLGSVFLVADNAASSRRDTLCWAYSIRVGFRGTSRFKTVSSCNNIFMANLPPDTQEFVYYSSDEMVLRGLKSGLFAPEDYVEVVPVNLPTGDTLKYQGFTYTPPSLSNSAWFSGE